MCNKRVQNSSPYKLWQQLIEAKQFCLKYLFSLFLNRFGLAYLLAATLFSVKFRVNQVAHKTIWEILYITVVVFH